MAHQNPARLSLIQWRQQKAALMAAIRYYQSERALARALGVTQPTVQYWKRIGQIPFDQAMRLVVLTQGAISLTQLRPDMTNVLTDYTRLTSPTQLN